MEFEWLTEQSQVEETARFFVENVESGPSYISHSELMFGRADTPTTWSRDLFNVVRREFTERANDDNGGTKRIALCIVDGALAGVALVEFETDAAIPFGVLEDIVVAQGERGNRIGQAFMDWIMDRMREKNLKRVFLESGLTNAGPHHWFEKNGFHQVSIVMMKSLDDDGDHK